jgi:transcriptional regulator with XRE-family HTH domain
MFAETIFAERLSLLRKQENRTLQQLAAVLGITKAAVGNLEHGRKKPSIDIAVALADYFAVSLDYLVGRSDDPARR